MEFYWSRPSWTKKKQNHEEYSWIYVLALTSVGRHWSPISWTILLDVRDKDDVLLRSPWTLLDANFITARRPPHGLLSPLSLTDTLSSGFYGAFTLCDGHVSGYIHGDLWERKHFFTLLIYPAESCHFINFKLYIVNLETKVSRRVEYLLSFPPTSRAKVARHQR